MDIDGDDIPSTPPKISTSAKAVVMNLLPEKSKEKYIKQYDEFITWCNARNINNYSESVLIAYIAEKAKTMKSSSLWSIYSMLRSTLSARNDIDISQYKKLLAFLKKKAVGYKAKKSKTFAKEEIQKFLHEAPDEKYLLKKVILIFGIAGACRRDELVKMNIDDVEDRGSILIVRIPDSKTHKSRVFTVRNDEENIDFLALYRKYVALRPETDTLRRLFLRYVNGKCTKQVIGMNIMGKIPSEIAQYLNLKEVNLYNGHSFRRTSASLLAQRGGDIPQLKCEGWKISNVVEGYIEENIKEEIETAQEIFSKPSSLQVETITNVQNFVKSWDVPSGSGIIVKNCENCTFNFTIVNPPSNG